jgi:hypothetical protein
MLPSAQSLSKKEYKYIMSNNKEYLMKKILSTTLVAIAFAMVSTVDAKRMKTPAKESAVNVIEAAKNVEVNPTANNKAELVAVIEEEANTPEKRRTLELRADEKRLLDGIAIVKERIKDIDYRWYNFFASTDMKQTYSAANDRLKTLEAELKDVRAQLGENVKETGKPWSLASKYVTGVVVVTGVTAAAIITDIYYGTGYTKAVAGKAMELGRRARTKAGSMYETGKGYASSAYDKLPSMRSTGK